MLFFRKVLKTKSAHYWVSTLNELGVPSGPVLTVPQVLDDPHLKGRDMITDIDVGGEKLQIAAAPVIVDDARPHATNPPPTLGAHNFEVWEEVGLSSKEIEQLQEEGVI